MTEELQRIKIAEALGGKYVEKVNFPPRILWVTPNQQGTDERFVVPSYPTNLSACTALIDFLEKRGYACVMVAQHGKRCCTFTTTGRPDYKAISDTFPKAICKSFLMVWGLWEVTK